MKANPTGIHPNSEADDHWTTISRLSVLTQFNRWRRLRLATGLALVRAGLRVAPATAADLVAPCADVRGAGCH